MQYQALNIGMDVSEYSIEEAAQIIGPSFVYELRINPLAVLTVRNFLKRWCADTEEHPLSPYINIIPEPDFGRDEWCLSANGKSAGSKGA